MKILQNWSNREKIFPVKHHPEGFVVGMLHTTMFITFINLMNLQYIFEEFMMRHLQLFMVLMTFAGLWEEVYAHWEF